MGGDEVPKDCWQSNPGIRRYMREANLTSFADLETLYEQRLLDMLEAKNKSYIAWQEIFDSGARIKNDTVIEVWWSAASMQGYLDWCETSVWKTRRKC